MGTLIYGNAGFSVEFDDHTLIHLQMVIGPKLRRRESFFFTWAQGERTSHARTSLWLDRSVALIFQFDEDQRQSVNREWLEILTVSANSAQGLQLIPEPASLVSAP
jgi:hypothetical protein